MPRTIDLRAGARLKTRAPKPSSPAFEQRAQQRLGQEDQPLEAALASSRSEALTTRIRSATARLFARPALVHPLQLLGPGLLLSLALGEINLKPSSIWASYLWSACSRPASACA